jgi:two-component system, cell cycle sensor histidine kinase and response regulator CckA
VPPSPVSSDLPDPDLTTLCYVPEEASDSFLLHPSPALLYDPETTRIIAANVAAEALYGWTRAELARMTLDDIRPPDQIGQLRANIEREERLGGSSWYHATHWRKDGEPMDVEVLSQPMRLQGRPVRRAVIIDVTARTRAEALFRGVADQSLTGVYVMQDGRFIYINPRLAEMFGYTRDEVMAESDPWRFLTADARAVAVTNSAGRLRGQREQIRYTLRAKHRDGSPVIVEVYGSSLALRGRPALLGTVLDVTERVVADAALEESERRFRAAFDQAMTAMALTAPDGSWLRVNPALSEMLGYSVEELMTMTFQSVTHPDDVAPNVALKDSLLAGEVSGYRMDKRFFHRDGSIVWAALNVALVRDEDGAPLYMVAQMTDVTARKRAELALGESEQLLRHAQKMEAVGRLAGGVAHDFNNLLTVIGSNAEMGEELAREGQATPDEFAEIRAAVERAASLTRQLLAFSRRQVLAPVALSLNEVVSDAERMLRRVIGEDVVLETRLEDGVGEVVADRGQLEQVLMNLVVNARDAMPDGGRVVIATRRTADGEVAMSVVDTGTGMDADTQAHAFEPFFTTKELGKGTGLGLSTVYGIAQQSGGHVSIRSMAGEGTTVTLTLPSSTTPEAVPVSRRSSGEHPAGETAEGDTILLVEDEAAVRAVARRILTRFGYTVIEARNGADALFLWSVHGPRVRLVLTDAVMPVMGGRELVERLQEIGADVPVLFMSGYADGERGGAVPAGAPLIGKPFSAEALIARVHAMLSPVMAAAPAPSDLRRR